MVLLLDKSGSVQGYESEIVRFAHQCIDQFVLGNHSANVGVIVFDGRAKTIASLTDDGQLLRSQVRDFVGGGAKACLPAPPHHHWRPCHFTTIPHCPYAGPTSISAALLAAADMLRTGRTGVRKFVLLLSDGRQSPLHGGDKVAIATAAAVRANQSLLSDSGSPLQVQALCSLAHWR